MLNPNKVKLAIAPIGWTNDDLPDLGAENTFEQCVSEMALAGFKGSEIGNKYPQDVAVLKHKLDVRGLQICNAWFSTLFTSEPYEVTIRNFIAHRDRLHALGAKVRWPESNSRNTFSGSIRDMKVSISSAVCTPVPMWWWQVRVMPFSCASAPSSL